MEAAALGDAPYPYHGDGDDVVAPAHPKWEPSPLQGRGLGEGPDRDDVRAQASVAADDAPSPSGADAPPSSPLESKTARGANGRGIGRVYINPEQYFEGVPEVAWNFHIGGYQPAQKWLKDRKGRSLSWDDIGHYQKIVKILIETDRIMKEIKLPLD